MGIRRNNERKSSPKHKMHLEYGLHDIAQLDAPLAREIEVLATAFGYAYRHHHHNNNNNNNNNNTWICLSPSSQK